LNPHAPRTFPRLLFAAAVLSLASARPAQAQDEVPVAPSDASTLHEPVALWEAGLVGIGAYQPAYPGADKNIARARLLPYAVYRGSVLRLDDGGVGVRAFRTPRFEWEASGTAAFGSSANQVKVREGMPSIGTLAEIGPALKINLGDLLDPRREARKTRLELPVRAVFEASHGVRHEGWTFEPRLTHTAWESGSASVVLSASTLFGDRRLNHLFYGVDSAYATPDRPQYDAKAGLVATRLGVSLRHRISSTVRLQWFAQVESVAGAANEDSPLVRKKEDAGFGVSLVWGAWHSAETGTE
jgi:hypothetical protein